VPLPLPILDSGLNAVRVEFIKTRFQNLTEFDFFEISFKFLFIKRSKLLILVSVNREFVVAFMPKEPNFGI
jgi:hypothetical protein